MPITAKRIDGIKKESLSLPLFFTELAHGEGSNQEDSAIVVAALYLVSLGKLKDGLPTEVRMFMEYADGRKELNFKLAKGKTKEREIPKEK